MTRAIAAFTTILATLVVLAQTAQTQPGGSYLGSCRDIRMRGDTLVATCRTRDRTWQRTWLDRVNRCVGDIGNVDGQLICNRR